jgi:hypothetical protein
MTEENKDVQAEEITPDPVETDQTKIIEENVLLKAKVEQITQAQAGETRKNTELQKTISDLQVQMDNLKRTSMSDEELKAHEMQKLREEINNLKVEKERFVFLDKVKTACSSLIVKYELDPDDFDFIFSENIEEMEKKALALSERDKKLKEKAKSDLRGSNEVGRPGNGNATVSNEYAYNNETEKTAIFKKIESEHGKQAAVEWLNQQSKLKQ